ncbi:N-formylglutamate amidohydrolase [Azospirillum halopraeferens]|uniref:N-formylglutamate amidohydrolase n=1 Tax=Azospirillum halopraeferens TaxID=34010 RepID=UPI00041B0E9B|nr:N-formylglutamate amidohydrolase [Azospirillum halopraeferens]
MSFVIEDVLVRHDPVGRRVPVLFDSPHSGSAYPADFHFACPLAALRQAEDSYVDELFAAVPEHGGTLLLALFPRTYIDPNRAVDDIAPDVLDGPWPEPLNPTDKSAAGMGLIRTLVRPGMALYDGMLTVAEVAERIDRYYRPYHFQVSEVLDRLVARFGAAWHVDCHSMPSYGPGGRVMPDFVLGDRDGTTCEPGFTAFVAGMLRRMGYTVTVNDPYKGVELVRRTAAPAQGRHALQIEINRRLYMDEETLEKSAGFAPLQRTLSALIAGICEHAAGRVAQRAAE